MADHVLTLPMTDEGLERLKAAAPPEGPTAAEALAEYDRTGVYETFEEWSTAFETDLKARLDARR